MRILFILFIGLLLQSCMMGPVNWDGAFLSGEYEYTFVNRDGKPIEGITLEVRDASGALSYKYPINEYVSEGSISSNSNGVIKFSHLSNHLEFGGRCYIFGFIEWGNCDPPEYKLIFNLNNKEIYSISYTTLSFHGEKESFKKVIQ